MRWREGQPTSPPLTTEMDLTARSTRPEHPEADSQYDTVINPFCSHAAISCSDLCLPNVMSWPSSHPTAGSYCVHWQYGKTEDWRNTVKVLPQRHGYMEPFLQWPVLTYGGVGELYDTKASPPPRTDHSFSADPWLKSLSSGQKPTSPSLGIQINNDRRASPPNPLGCREDSS